MSSTLIKLATTDSDTERLLKASVLLEREKTKNRILTIQNQILSSKNEVLKIMLSQACDEIEGIFRSTGEMASLEIAAEYTVWARYLEINYGRKEHFVYQVQEWIEGHNA